MKNGKLAEEFKLVDTDYEDAVNYILYQGGLDIEK